MEDEIKRLTFPTYESASQRSKPEQSEEPSTGEKISTSETEPFNVYSIENLAPIFFAATSLIGILISPYLVLPICATLMNSSSWWNGPLLQASSLIMPAIAVICVVNVLVYSFHKPTSHVSGIVGYNSVGATTTPGLYHSSSKLISGLLLNCPILTSSASILGCLPSLSSTPWVFSGDMRTILPFLTFNPKQVSYIRRWVSACHVEYFFLFLPFLSLGMCLSQPTEIIRVLSFKLFSPFIFLIKKYRHYSVTSNLISLHLISPY